MAAKKFSTSDLMAQMMAPPSPASSTTATEPDSPSKSDLENQDPQPINDEPTQNRRAKRGAGTQQSQKIMINVGLDATLRGKLDTLMKQHNLTLVDLISTAVAMFIETYETKTGKPITVSRLAKQKGSARNII